MGEARLDLSHLVASLGPSLLAATLWTILLASFATVLTRARRSYQHGLSAAVIAFLATMGVTIALAGLWQGAPMWIVILIIAPLVEESARLLLANELRNDPPAWLAFGLGYGLFEAGLKLGDAVALEVRDPAHSFVTLVALVGPVIPLLLHIFLSVLMLALLRKGVSPLLVWFTAVIAHGLHNWSVMFFFTTNVTHLAGGHTLRIAVFLALIALILPLSARNSEGAAR